MNQVDLLDKLVPELQDIAFKNRDRSLTIAELGLKLETRVKRQVSVVDMLETRVQETQQVVADLDSSLTKLEDDLELRVDEIAESVLDGSREIQVLARAVKNLEQWSDEVAYRYLRPLEDRVTHLETMLVLRGAPPAQGGIQVLGALFGSVPVIMQRQFQQFVGFFVPLVQFLDRMVDIPAACSSWLQQTVDFHRYSFWMVVDAMTGALVGRAENCGVSAAAVVCSSSWTRLLCPLVQRLGARDSPSWPRFLVLLVQMHLALCFRRLPAEVCRARR